MGRIDEAFQEREVKMWQLRVRDHIVATMSVLFALLIGFDSRERKGRRSAQRHGSGNRWHDRRHRGEQHHRGRLHRSHGGHRAPLNAVPELKTVANVKGEQVFQIASENMNNDYWLKLAKRVNTLLAQDDVDGIVITHGTDTIEETSYFLDLVVKSKKPVVIVGAMRPSTAISADGPINLFNAVILAGSEEAVGKGVLVALNDQINAARDVTKNNTSTADTFRTPELGFLGYMQGNKPYFYRQSTRRHTADSEFDVSNLDILPQVDIVYGYANMNRVAIDAFVAAGAKGIVHAGVGDGSLARPAVEPALDEAHKKGVVDRSQQPCRQRHRRAQWRGQGRRTRLRRLGYA